MKNTLIILAIFLSFNTYSQSIKQIDSISNDSCEYLKSLNQIKNDTVRLNTLYENKFYPYLRKIGEAKADEIGKKLYYRLQRNCIEFRELLDRLEPPKESVTRTTIKPTTKLTNKELKKFKKREAFKYFEVNGDTTKVEMKNQKWTDSFADATYSKLNYKWISNYEFELEFIESNNETRSNFSAKGDKFIYGVLELKSDHYIMSVNIETQKTYEVFKLYFD